MNVSRTSIVRVNVKCLMDIVCFFFISITIQLDELCLCSRQPDNANVLNRCSTG